MSWFVGVACCGCVVVVMVCNGAVVYRGVGVWCLLVGVVVVLVSGGRSLCWCCVLGGLS